MKLIPDFTKRLHEDTLPTKLREWFVVEKGDYEWYQDIYGDEHLGIGYRKTWEHVLEFHLFEFFRRLRSKYFLKSSYKGNKKYREEVLNSFPFIPYLESLFSLQLIVREYHGHRNEYEETKNKYPSDLASSDLFNNAKIDEIGDYEIEQPEIGNQSDD